MPDKAPTHRPPNSGAKRHAKKQDRPSAAMRGYGRAWWKLRRFVLARDPLCVDCHSRASTEVDHIVALKMGGGNHPANLRGLCKPCHSSKTCRVDGGLRGAQKRQ